MLGLSMVGLLPDLRSWGDYFLSKCWEADAGISILNSEESVLEKLRGPASR